MTSSGLISGSLLGGILLDDVVAFLEFLPTIFVLQKFTGEEVRDRILANIPLHPQKDPPMKLLKYLLNFLTLYQCPQTSIRILCSRILKIYMRDMKLKKLKIPILTKGLLINSSLLKHQSVFFNR